QLKPQLDDYSARHEASRLREDADLGSNLGQHSSSRVYGGAVKGGSAMTDPRLALPEMERTLSRRALLMNIGKGVGVMAAYDKFGSRLFGAATSTDEQTYPAG